jgi:hypothetical protein
MVSLLRVAPDGRAHHSEIHLQGSADWNLVWGRLRAQASELDLKMIRLDVNAPFVYEGYHAHWHCLRNGSEEGAEWRAEIPLTVGGQTTGRIEAVGRRGLEPVSVQIATLVELAESLEPTVAKLSRAEDQAVPVSDGPVSHGQEAGADDRGRRVPDAKLRADMQAGITV